MKQKLYSALASLVQARLNCLDHESYKGSNDVERARSVKWARTHRERIETLARNRLPSGSGIDSGTKVDLERSTGDKLVLSTSFHHMNEHGVYDGWTEHRVVVRPSLVGEINIAISGRNRNNIKSYLHDVFREALCVEVETWADDGPPREGV